MTSHRHASLSLLMGWSGSSWEGPKHRTRWYWSAAACRHSLLQYRTCGGRAGDQLVLVTKHNTFPVFHRSELFFLLPLRTKPREPEPLTWQWGQAWCSSGRTRHSSWCGRLSAGMPLSLLAFSSAVSRARKQYSQARCQINGGEMKKYHCRPYYYNIWKSLLRQTSFLKATHAFCLTILIYKIITNRAKKAQVPLSLHDSRSFIITNHQRNLINYKLVMNKSVFLQSKNG